MNAQNQIKVQRCTLFLRQGLRLLCGLALIALVSLAGTEAVRAFDDASCTATYPREKWLQLDCAPGFASPRDRVFMFVRAGVDPAVPWQRNINFDDAVWFFHTNGSPEPNLIIDFRRNGPGLAAYIYDDGDGDGRVAYRLRGEQVEVQENRGLWTMRITAPEGWWVRDAKVNFNVNIDVDAQLPGTHLVAETYLPILRTDGWIDWTVYVRDTNQDGRPDVEWRQLTPPPPVNDGWGIIRTVVMHNTTWDEPPIQGSLWWPFLGTKAEDRLFGGLSNPPPIQVDLERGKVAGVGESVASRGKNGNYFIYSMRRLGPGTDNQADFENPFAFYKLAQANDEFPDLSIRQQVSPPAGAPYDNSGSAYCPCTQVQYTWDQQHRQQWDYEIGLAGLHGIDSEIDLPEFSVRSVPYEQYPYWVTEKRWPVATFVATEGIPYWNNEHIYEWTTHSAGLDLWRYFLGITEHPPIEAFNNIRPGMRGEFTFHLNAQPYLYLSPIDHKLHLMKAQAGVWNADSRITIRYKNLGGDFIGQWTREESGAHTQALYFVEGQLILANEAGVHLRDAGVPSASFITLPPRNHEEWARIGSQLERHRPQFDDDGTNLESMFNQFEGHVQQISGGRLSGFRSTKEGFRFILDVAEGTNSGLVLPEGLSEGRYEAVFTRGKGYSIEPLSSPKLAASVVVLASEAIDVLSPIVFSVTVHNYGGEDVYDMTVKLHAQRTDGYSLDIDEVPLSIPGRESANFQTTWIPPSEGEWVIQAMGSGTDISGEAVTLEIQAKPTASLSNLLQLQGLANLRGSLVVALLLVALIITGVLGARSLA